MIDCGLTLVFEFGLITEGLQKKLLKTAIAAETFKNVFTLGNSSGGGRTGSGTPTGICPISSIVLELLIDSIEIQKYQV